MATDMKNSSDASVTELVAGIVSDAQDLFKQQIELLKHEVRDDLRKTRDAGLLVGVGAAFGLVAAMLLVNTLVYLLHWAVPSLPLWVCYGIWSGVTLLIGGGLIYTGMAKFNSFNPLPNESIV